jgi:3alpha(or 20beta)-hydroxysteroid dehydrogenase
MARELQPDIADADFSGANSLGRVGQPREIAQLAMFLASDESSYCTGAEFVADGGQLAGIVNPFARASFE